uniref:Uncharacterized protein n=1 Tax=Glossina brevipalpis TaxID=37001 RepID=A0A1A9WFV0_9MUSC
MSHGILYCFSTLNRHNQTVQLLTLVPKSESEEGGILASPPRAYPTRDIVIFSSLDLATFSKQLRGITHQHMPENNQTRFCAKKLFIYLYLQYMIAITSAIPLLFSYIISNMYK